MSRLCIIPARGGSKRIPGKNIRDFLGKPIIAYSIEAAIRSELFDTVMVSTDDEEIKKVSLSFDAEVPFLRSKKNSTDNATTIDVILEVLEKYKSTKTHFEKACCIYPTAPLITAANLEMAHELMISGSFTAVLPITPYNYPIQRSLLLDEHGKVVMAQPENKNTRTQDLTTHYHDCGQFYWFDVKSMIETKNIWTNNTGALILPLLNVQDIDNEEDWKMAELKYTMIHNGSTR